MIANVEGSTLYLPNLEKTSPEFFQVGHFHFCPLLFFFFVCLFAHHILLFFSLIKLIFYGLPHLGGKSCAFLKKAQTFLM